MVSNAREIRTRSGQSWVILPLAEYQDLVKLADHNAASAIKLSPMVERREKRPAEPPPQIRKQPPEPGRSARPRGEPARPDASALDRDITRALSDALEQYLADRPKSHW